MWRNYGLNKIYFIIANFELEISSFASVTDLHEIYLLNLHNFYTKYIHFVKVCGDVWGKKHC